MFQAELRCPTPQVARVTEGWRGKGRKRSRAEGRKERSVLTCDYGGVFPIQSQAGSLQANESKIHAVACLRESTGKIHLNIGGRLGAANGGTENLKANFRLPQCGSQRSFRRTWLDRLREVGKIEAVCVADVAERIHKNDAVEPGAILGGGFNLSLVLFINFGAN